MILRGKVKKLVLKSKEAALLAVSIYNNPLTTFKSYAYIVNMCIAWTALFHAIFEKNKIKYFYKKGTKKLEYEKIDGEYKAWDLKKCCQEYYKDRMEPTKANLETLITIRNKIEHRFLPELDSHIFGDCQSCLFNYEELLKNEFGIENTINASLTFSLQFSEIYNTEQIKSMKSLKNKEIENIQKYLDEYRKKYNDEILNSMQYSFRAFLIPKIGNHINSCDKSIDFIRESDLNDEQRKNIKKIVALIKDRTISVSNEDKLRPSQVASEVDKELNFKFNVPNHTLCWKYFNVRPGTGAERPEETNQKYCIYDKAHNDYLYTMAWVKKLIRELSDEKTRIKILNK